jgi:hypothetical protein
MLSNLFKKIKKLFSDYFNSDIDYEFEEFLDATNADYYQKLKGKL